MHAADDTLRDIVAEFRALGEADRRAIVARLRFDERMRFEAALRPRAAMDGISPELAALAQGDGLTEAARAALSAALGERPAPAPVRPTLIDRLWRR
ncbi:MAG: hypothetical protein PGN21_10195 [Sphingomonas paucimobilis]